MRGSSDHHSRCFSSICCQDSGNPHHSNGPHTTTAPLLGCCQCQITGINVSSPVLGHCAPHFLPPPTESNCLVTGVYVSQSVLPHQLCITPMPKKDKRARYHPPRRSSSNQVSGNHVERVVPRLLCTSLPSAGQQLEATPCQQVTTSIGIPIMSQLPVHRKTTKGSMIVRRPPPARTGGQAVLLLLEEPCLHRWP